MNIFLLFGIALFFGVIGSRISDKLRIPQVVGYIFIGLILGTSFLNIINKDIVGKLDIFGTLALALIGFTIGGELKFKSIAKLGKSVPIIAISEALGAFILVFTAVYLLMGNIAFALIFGALASATAPAATVDVLWQYKSRGPLTTTLFAVVGIDDAIALMIYGFAAAFAKVFITHKSVSFQAVATPFIEIISSIVLGIGVAFLLHILLKRIHTQKDNMIFVLGAIMLVTGVTRYFHASIILTNMAFGITLINLGARNKKAFDAISLFAPPVFLIFFVTVGARMDIMQLRDLGLLGLIYIVMRVLGKGFGAYGGARFSKAPDVVRKYLGFGLLSQAGVAIGLAIEASKTFKNYGATGAKLGFMVINVIAATTFVFQIFGPPLTKFAIFKAKEVNEPSR